MIGFSQIDKAFVTVICAVFFLIGASLGAQAQDDAAVSADGVDDLLALLATPDLENWEDVENKIRIEWARSGSHAMDLLLKRAEGALIEGQNQIALEHATALTDHAPHFAEGWNILGAAYYNLGRYGPALDAIERTLQLNPDHFAALNGLGLILEDLGDEEGALFAYKAAVAVHPHLEHVQASIARLTARAEGQET